MEDAASSAGDKENIKVGLGWVGWGLGWCWVFHNALSLDFGQ